MTTVETFYDRHIRLWTTIPIENDLICGVAGYGMTKQESIEDCQNHYDNQQLTFTLISV